MKELLVGFYFKYQINEIINNKKVLNLNDYIFIHNATMISLSDENKTLFQFGLKYPYERVIFKLKNDLVGGQNLMRNNEKYKNAYL